MIIYKTRHLSYLDEKSEIYIFLKKIENKLKNIKLINNNSVNFVGIIINKDTMLYSFPKQYPIIENGSMDCKLLFKTLSTCNKKIGFDYENNKNHFPFLDYLNIFDYYKKYGLYTEVDTCNSTRPIGRINWKHTILKSNKILSNNGLILYPMIYESVEKNYVFLSECMDFILSDMYNNVFKNLDNNFKYIRKYHNTDFTNINFIINKLYEILNKTFKDKIIKLIKSCINYFKWIGNFGSIFGLFTTDFNMYWQNMVHHYINGMKIKPVYKCKESTNTIDNIILKNETSDNLFHYEFEKYFIVDSTCEKKFNIKIDHFLYDSNNVYILDSKYYNDISTEKINYKQCAYYYFLKTKKEYMNKLFYNILIYPTGDKNTINLLINRSSIQNDNLIVSSMFLNIRDVMKYFVS